MPDIDFNALLNAAMGGGAVWAAIRAEIKFLWRDVKNLQDEFKELHKKFIELQKSR